MVDEEENLDFLAALAALGDPPDEEQSSVCPVPDCATQNMKRARTHDLRANHACVKRLRVELLADEAVCVSGWRRKAIRRMASRR